MFFLSGRKSFASILHLISVLWLNKLPNACMQRTFPTPYLVKLGLWCEYIKHTESNKSFILCMLLHYLQLLSSPIISGKLIWLQVKTFFTRPLLFLTLSLSVNITDEHNVHQHYSLTFQEIECVKRERAVTIIGLGLGLPCSCFYFTTL